MLLTSAGTVENTASDAVLVAVIVAVAVAVGLHRRRRRNELGLQRGERVVALSQQWLDPIIVLVIVGATLRQELTDPAHVGLAVAGVLIGGVAGYVRGRLLFLEARPDLGRVVLRRGVAEIAIVAGLLVLTYAARHFSDDIRSPLNLLATVALTVGVAESVTRVAYITWRYQQANRARVR